MPIEVTGVSKTRTLRYLKDGSASVTIPIEPKISQFYGIKPGMICKYLLIFPDISEKDMKQALKQQKHGSSFLNLFNKREEKKQEYDYYIIQQRIGGMNGRWEEIGQHEEIIDIITGTLTYCSEHDITIRCLGAHKSNGKEIRRQLWVHHSQKDVEEAKIEAKRKTQQSLMAITSLPKKVP